MATELVPSEFRVEKQRANAVLTLSSGQSTEGCFFTAGGSARHAGPEGVGDLLNSETGFFPFEVHGAEGNRTVLFNRSHVVMVVVADNEARRDSGYSVAKRHVVSLLLSSGQRVVGAVRIYRPEGRDRLSDWAQHPEAFQYVETAEATFIVNMAHIVDMHEVSEP
jgi:hypothetical protein